MRRRLLIEAALAASLPAGALAQAHIGSYPDRPVRIVLPFTPGGAIDQMARVAAEMFTRSHGQSFVVDSRPGGEGVVGTTSVVRAPADGHTLLAASASAITIAPLLLPEMPYDPLKDLQPIVMLGDSPIAVIVRRPSGNRFLIDAATRLTRLRRLAGYVVALDLTRLATQVREHLTILTRIEAADRAGAAELLVRHLEAGRQARVRLLADAAGRLGGLSGQSREPT